MKQLNWYQIFGQTHTIPDGSIVTPTDDVQILLNCANIWNKAYTTIADLLSDTASLSAVIADNNAINYLVRSTTFASSMTADATAMTDIGGNNYASNTLLGDSTWCTAICNSTYFESVLNVKVPTMTSNTEPSGECFRDSAQTVYQAWRSFDGDASSGNYVWGTSYGTGRYVGYDFQKPIKIYLTTIDIYGNHVSGSLTNAQYKVQEDVNGTITDLSSSRTVTLSANNHSLDSVIVSSSGTAGKFRIYSTGQTISGNDTGFLTKVQFYGRANV